MKSAEKHEMGKCRSGALKSFSEPTDRRLAMSGWRRPKLVILYRSKPEESVLVFCKVHHNEATHMEGPNRANSRCHLREPCKENMCYARSVS